MQKVLDALSSSQHALLESPTGTGKTLALLTSSVAYLSHLKSLIPPQPIESPKLNKNKNKGKPPLPRILYTSRTHSQLEQVVRELKKLPYTNIKVAVMGSRD